MKKGFLTTVLLISCLFLWAQGNPLWMRYPAISPDGKMIAFSHRGNMYVVPSKGGKARVIVKNESHNIMPVWSRDSRFIAYAGNQYGNYDIYIIPVKGGNSKRLTFHSADEFPYNFFPDNSAVVFGASRLDDTENRQFPSEALTELYAVPATGGRVQQLLTTTAEDAKVSSDGNRILYHDRKGRENPWRKHQMSSIARDIWLFDKRKGNHTKISQYEGENRSPVFAKSEQYLYYLSERDGSFNIYGQSLNDSISRQLTFFKDAPIRFLSIAFDNTLCFGWDGQIYLKKENKEAVKVNIEFEIPSLKNQHQTVEIEEANEWAVSPNGKEFAFISRGEVFVGDFSGNSIKQITHTSEAEHSVSFSPDGKTLLYASERGGRWKVILAQMSNPLDSFFYASSTIEEKVIIANDNENYQPAFSPNGKEIAYIENRNSLKIFDIKSGNSKAILGNEHLLSRRDHDQYFRWSPDGKWLLVQYMEQGQGNQEVGLVSTSGHGKVLNLSKNGYNDEAPIWMADGKMIVWNSDRKGLRNENRSNVQSDIYALILDEVLLREIKGGITDSSQVFRQGFLDLELSDPLNRLSDRTLRLTTSSSFLGEGFVTKDGMKLYYLEKKDAFYDVWVLDVKSREKRKLLELNVQNAELKSNINDPFLYVLSGNEIIKLDPEKSLKESVFFKTQIIVNTFEERKALFEHIWRRTNETFYTRGFHGANWQKLKGQYSKYILDIDNNIDFTEMLNELLGELNVSHTAATFKDNRKGKDATASLGVFYDKSYLGAGVKIKEIIRNGPLDYSFLGISAGDVIESINGKVIDAKSDIDSFLNHKSGVEIRLKMRTQNGIKELKVKPISLSTEEDLLYQRWVKKNEEETFSKSKGSIGYIHLYRMNDEAFRNTYQDVLGKFANCKALVVDTRFNRGGDLAPELVSFLSGRPIRVNTNDEFVRNSEPSSRSKMITAVLANEANYSDGQCFAYDYQILHMGKLIGMPIPGSCTWMTGQTLQDPTLHFSVPTFGVKTMQGRYMENYQTEPDIQVVNDYQSVSMGKDLQLERAISELMSEINQNMEQ